MAKYCVSFIALPLPVIVRTICLFDNFEKLSMLLGFSRDVLEGWARVCCVHVFLVYIGIYPWIPVTQEWCVQSRGLVCCWPNLTLFRSVLKQIDLISFFFPLYGSLRRYLHHLNTEASKWLKTGKRNVFLVACSWITFRGHLSNWTISDLKERFSKLAP